jgi:hypothetical protein
MGHMTLVETMEWLGEPQTAALGGLAIGLLFGAAAQQSRFCLRAAIISFARRRFDTRLSVWLLVFSGALIATQALYVAGVANLDEARQIATQGSLSGRVDWRVAVWHRHGAGARLCLAACWCCRPRATCGRCCPGWYLP